MIYMRKISFLIAAAVVILASCGNKNESKQTAATKYVVPDSLIKSLEIDTVRATPFASSLTLTGQVDFDEDHVIKVYPMVSGMAQDIKVALGDYVQQGQVLAVVHSSDMAGYTSDLASANATVKIAKKNVDVTADMYSSGLASAKDNLQAQMEYEQAQAALDKAKTVIQNNGGATGNAYYVKAPISGFIVEKNINNGMAIRPDNSASLFTISDLKTVWVMANVYESNIPYIKTGDSVSITTLADKNKVFRGKIDKIMDMLDPASKVMKVRIVLPNDHYELKPQMFASVVVNYSENKNMLAVPGSALVFDNSQYYVLVYNSPSDIKICPVQINGTNGNMTYILNGLQEGERIITRQALLIYQALNG